jgi:hypothetical protein
MSGFAQEYLNEGASENYLTPPNPGTSPTGPPYTRSSNYILRQTLEARDAAQAAALEATSAASGLDIAALPARP